MKVLVLLWEGVEGLCLWHVWGFGPEHAEGEIVDQNTYCYDEDDEDLL